LRWRSHSMFLWGRNWIVEYYLDEVDGSVLYHSWNLPDWVKCACSAGLGGTVEAGPITVSAFIWSGVAGCDVVMPIFSVRNFETTRAICCSWVCSWGSGCGLACKIHGRFSGKHGNLLWISNITGRGQYFEVRTTNVTMMLRANSTCGQVAWFIITPSLNTVSSRTLSLTYSYWLTGQLHCATVSAAASVQCVCCTFYMIWLCSSGEISSRRCGGSTWLLVSYICVSIRYW
jgi:hypothetical protein